MPQDSLFPLEIVVEGTPVSMQAKRASTRERWRETIRRLAQERQRETDELGFLDDRPVAVTILYFVGLSKQGDIDNFVKPILDALIGVAFLDDDQVERVAIQRIPLDIALDLREPGERLQIALARPRPIVYIRVDDDLRWRTL